MTSNDVTQTGWMQYMTYDDVSCPNNVGLYSSWLSWYRWHSVGYVTILNSSSLTSIQRYHGHVHVTDLLNQIIIMFSVSCSQSRLVWLIAHLPHPGLGNRYGEATFHLHMAWVSKYNRRIFQITGCEYSGWLHETDEGEERKLFCLLSSPTQVHAFGNTSSSWIIMATSSSHISDFHNTVD